jgi:hypothetical protein
MQKCQLGGGCSGFGKAAQSPSQVCHDASNTSARALGLLGATASARLRRVRMNRAVRFVHAVTKTRDTFTNEGVCAGFSFFVHSSAYTARVETAAASPK